MPQRAKNPEHRWYFYPIEPPEDVLEWENWPQYQVCIPGPLISYLLNVMRIYQWDGRVKTDDPAKAAAFVQAWNDLVARVGASVESAECEAVPYPIFRMNPDNHCQMQQSLDSGATWTTVLDTGACQPVIPTPPPMIRLRQNPTQPQLLQQSLDSGATWTTAYDYSKYQNPFSSHTDTVIYNTEVNTFIENNNTLWDESSHDVTIFAPELVFNGSPQDADRNKAICYASRVFVSTIMETAFQSAATPSAGDSFAGLVFTAVVTALGTAIGGPVGAAIGAFFSTSLIAIVNSASDQWTRERYSQYEDQLVCCMYTALKDEIPTQARFAAAFSGSECDLNPEAQEFVDALITPLLTDEQSFLAFMRLAAEGVQLGAFLPECPCDPPPPEDCHDFAISDYGWYPGNNTGVPSEQFGHYDPGAGLAPWPSSPFYFYWWRPATGSSQLVNSVTFEFNQTTTKFRFSRGSGGIVLEYDGSATTTVTFDNSTDPGVFPIDLNAAFVSTFDVFYAPSDTMRVVAFCWDPAV